MIAPTPPSYARVVVDVAPAHLDRPFDYRVPEGIVVEVGHQVRVVFAGRRRTGWVVDLSRETQTTAERLLDLVAVEGEDPWFDAEDLALYRWVAQRYAATLADVLRHALPSRIAAVEREGRPPPAQPPADRGDAGRMDWRRYDADALIRAVGAAAGVQPPPAFWLRPMPDVDAAELTADLVRRCLAAGRTALVLGPDPASASPAAALRAAAGAGVDLRVPDRARYRAFLRCRRGDARVAVGERSALFAPLRDLGLVLVDDEANPAYKERRSPRHHVREVALARARMAGAVCVLIGDLPSANLWRLLGDGHVQAVRPDRGTERRASPRVDIVDTSDPKPGTRRARFTESAARALGETVRGGGTAVVLASRGGQGAALVCRNCRLRLTCPVCAGSLAVGRDEHGWRCPACAWAGAAFSCPDCGDVRFSPLAAGAGRLAAELRRSHPSADVARMEGFDAPGPRGRPGIGVMTRGSVVSHPAWLRGRRAGVTVIPDADAMLLRPGFDAAEDTLRLWFAAARWAQRTVVQTREPGHHAVGALVRWDPEGFWEREAPRRSELGYPPAASLIQLRAVEPAVAQEVAGSLREVLAPDEVLGPDQSGAILLKTVRLRGTLAALKPLREDWGRRDLKVRIDVDPLL